MLAVTRNSCLLHTSTTPLTPNSPHVPALVENARTTARCIVADTYFLAQCILAALPSIMSGHFSLITRAYVNRRGPRRKGVNMDVILSSLSLMAASKQQALVRGIAISIIITPRAHARARGYVIGRGVYILYIILYQRVR